MASVLPPPAEVNGLKTPPVALDDPFSDFASPVVAELNLALVEPDIMPAPFQVGLNTKHQFFVAVMAIAEENAPAEEWLGLGDLPMNRANPEITGLRQRLLARWTAPN